MREGIHIIEDLSGTLSIALVVKPKTSPNLIELPINLKHRVPEDLERDIREMYDALSSPRLKRDRLGRLIDPDKEAHHA